MKRHQFVRMMEAAAAIVQTAANHPGVLDDHVVEWASTLLRQNVIQMRASPECERMLKLWDNDLLAGYTFTQIHAWMGADRKKTTHWGLVCKLVGDGTLFSLIDRGFSLYFASRIGRDHARPQFEADAAQRAEARKVRDKAAKRAWDEANKGRPRPSRLKAKQPTEKPPKEPKMTSKNEQKILNRGAAVTTFNHDGQLLSNKAKRAAEKQAPVPKGQVDTSRAKLTLCPSSKDTRFTPVLPPEGGEFSRDWAAARATGVSALTKPQEAA